MMKLKIFNHQTGNVQETTLTSSSQSSEAEWLIGRGTSCHLVLDGSDVSRLHGKITLQNGEYFYMDMGSANGSCLNNEALPAKHAFKLKGDDLIRIGDFVLLIEALDESANNSLRSSGDVSIWKNLHSDFPIWSQGKITVRCVRITPETLDVKTFTFVAEPAVLFRYQPGQFVTLELEINGELILRSYSISSTPTRPHTLEITVKRVPAPSPDLPAGLVSNWLHNHLSVGSTLQINGPLGKFTCAPNPPKKLLLISAGSGITPMMSMMRWLADTVSPADVCFLYCARTPSDIIFRQELELMAARLPQVHLSISTTRPTLGQPWFGFTGRLTEAMLCTIAPDFLERTVYVCGPQEFMQSAKALLKRLNFPMQQYYEESFGAPKKAKQSAEPPKSAAAAPPSTAPSSSQSVVVFTQSGKEVPSGSDESILDLAEQAGVKIRSNCRQGVCGACKKRKLEGEIQYAQEPEALDADEQAAGYILTCVAASVGRVLIEA
ncbi:MAG: FHA domain-containing protein [Synechococcales cyanobacterium M58_A2018_015]|nr:FHA domain-containing protein [Synechococcales cyanobacterium M58_A2018_015]